MSGCVQVVPRSRSDRREDCPRHWYAAPAPCPCTLHARGTSEWPASSSIPLATHPFCVPGAQLGAGAAIGMGTGPREPPRCSSRVSCESGRCVGRVPCHCRVHLCPIVSGVARARCFVPAVSGWCARAVWTELQRCPCIARHGPERPQPSPGPSYIAHMRNTIVVGPQGK
jgi:hypothetical protein